MSDDHSRLVSKASPTDILGVAIDAGQDEIRAAYLKKVKEFPAGSLPPTNSNGFVMPMKSCAILVNVRATYSSPSIPWRL